VFVYTVYYKCNTTGLLKKVQVLGHNAVQVLVRFKNLSRELVYVEDV